MLEVPRPPKNPTCPHCHKAFHGDPQKIVVGGDSDSNWVVESIICPACLRLILELVELSRAFSLNPPNYQYWQPKTRILIRPRTISRRPFPKKIPDEYRKDYEEACLILNDSPKASAALSRRCLQLLLREEAKTTAKDLADQITEVLDSGKLPSYIAKNVDVIRNFGNFAAHANKLKTTGEIVEVESGEADWCLEILEDLIDFYIIQPGIAEEKRAALEQTLKEMKKPPLKQPPTS